MLRTANKKRWAQSGFTLIEIMLVVVVMVVIGGITVPVYQSFQVTNNLDVAAYTVVHTLRRAQGLFPAWLGGSTWGVHIASGNLTLFKGASFAARDSTFDEIAEISTNITPSGITDVVFSKLSGEPQTTGNIMLTTSNNETKTVAINAKGMIEYW
jgi:prepilin-type N-terminal cleavage/methylation domain-containing protein